MSYRVNSKHIECALNYLNDRLGKEDGELGCIRTYNNNVVQLVTEGGGIRVLAYTKTKREAYDTIQAFIDFHRYTQEVAA